MSLIGKTDKEVQKTLHNFTFSSTDMEKLTGSNTLVNILVDQSSSVMDFKDELEKALTTVIDSCKKSPMAETILVRVATFASKYGKPQIEEIHGFLTLSEIATDQYIGKINPSGCTPLFDATGDALETIEAFAKQLSANDYFCNAISFVITDGMNTDIDKYKSPTELKAALTRIKQHESLESIRSILIGVGDSDAVVKQYLAEFNTEAGFDEFISIGDATPSKLAKLANWISTSVSSQSQSLGSGGPSQPINFSL